MSTFLFCFVFWTQKYKHFVSFLLIKNCSLCKCLYSSFDQTISSCERFRFVSIFDNFKIVAFFAWFYACSKKKHFFSINFISKLKISLCKRFYSSYDQSLDSLKRFRFVSTSKLYYRRTFMNLDIPTHDSVFCCFKSMKY